MIGWLLQELEPWSPTFDLQIELCALCLCPEATDGNGGTLVLRVYLLQNLLLFSVGR